MLEHICYLLSRFLISVQQIVTGALLIVKYYVIGIIWGNESTYLDMRTCLHIYNLHGLDEN